ncbi:MAG: M23 family metallopeptidase [Rikenellaceae bacterium]|nr:M23 family metallopeptidase [Rikenellaceae bacterium]
MRKVINVIFLIIPFVVFSQKLDDKSIYGKILNHFNEYRYDDIYDMYGDGMQNQLRREDSGNFFRALKNNYGNALAVNVVDDDTRRSKVIVNFQKDDFLMDVGVDDSLKISVLTLEPIENEGIPESLTEIHNMGIPFEGEWFVLWGGDTMEENYHRIEKSQQYAYDFIKLDAINRSFTGTGSSNGDYYCWGKKIFSPCDGEVVFAMDGIYDNEPGKVNPAFLLGNCVVIKTYGGTYLIFAHLKENSVAVKAGDPVKKGGILGLCGNSGNSTEPHLHIHAQDSRDFNYSRGVKIYFENIYVNGSFEEKYSPVKFQRVGGLNIRVD